METMKKIVASSYASPEIGVATGALAEGFFPTPARQLDYYYSLPLD